MTSTLVMTSNTAMGASFQPMAVTRSLYPRHPGLTLSGTDSGHEGLPHLEIRIDKTSKDCEQGPQFSLSRGPNGSMTGRTHWNVPCMRKPSPKDRVAMTTRAYDLVIVGAGSGNTLPTKELAGWRIAVVEADRFGGTCLNRGCIPSKMLVHTANLRPYGSAMPRDSA